jgi:cytokinin dehydrogenase
MSKLSRRGMIQGLLAGAVVLGFDPARRSWVTEASAAPCMNQLPALDGFVSTDPAALAAAADDFGHIVHRMPVAVLYPASVNDVVAVVKYARAQGIRISGRGKGHTVMGQAQAEAGLVIDMTTLDTIHSIECDRAVVDGGVVWRDLLTETTAVGLTPPVLTDFTGLTVAGTLSVGGINGTSHRHGAQVDNVLELMVVTGEGKLVTCSPNHRKDLFDAALAGLGMCAIIVRATIRLIPAEERARTFRVFYPDVATMLQDLRLVTVGGGQSGGGHHHHHGGCGGPRFDHVRANASPGVGQWAYFLEGTVYYSAPDEPDPDDYLDGLNHIPGSLLVEDVSYFEFCDAVYQLVQLLGQLGLLGLPHPWLDIFVPGSAAESFCAGTMASLDPDSFLPGSLIAFQPFIGSKLQRPLFRVPDEEYFVLVDILRTAPPDPAAVDAILQLNRALYDQNKALGGTQYTISALQLSPHDWKKHFQPAWGKLVSAKHKYDPDNVLGAGPGVFP